MLKRDFFEKRRAKILLARKNFVKTTMVLTSSARLPLKVAAQPSRKNLNLIVSAAVPVKGLSGLICVDAFRPTPFVWQSPRGQVKEAINQSPGSDGYLEFDLQE